MRPEAPGALRALRHRNFRVFYMGHALSSVGTKMQEAALLWHLYDLTGSAWAVGAIGLAQVVPLLATVLIGGVVADAVDRRILMLRCQSGFALFAGGLGVITLASGEAPVLLYAVAAAGAAIDAFDGPARKALIPRLVPAADLPAAISLAAMAKNGAKLAGPALMGLIASQLGLGMVYLVNAASFVVVIAGLLAIGPQPVGAAAPKMSLGAALAALREGFGYVRRVRLLATLMVLDFLATFTASATALLPVVSKEVLGLDEMGYGLLATGVAAGALAASLALVAVPRVRKQGRLVIASTALFGFGTLVFGLAASPPFCYFALMLVGAGDTVATVLRNTIQQLETPDALRGRITAVNMVFAKSGPRLGEVEAGAVAAAFGVGASIISGGIACILSVLAIAVLSPRLRRYDSAVPEKTEEP